MVTVLFSYVSKYYMKKFVKFSNIIDIVYFNKNDSSNMIKNNNKNINKNDNKNISYRHFIILLLLFILLLIFFYYIS